MSCSFVLIFTAEYETYKCKIIRICSQDKRVTPLFFNLTYNIGAVNKLGDM